MIPTLLLQARHVVPITSPPLMDAIVAIAQDRILAVGPAHQIRQQYPQVPLQDLGDAVILPGLINAHAHLEIPGPPLQIGKHPSFDQWVFALLKTLPASPSDQAKSLPDILATGAAQSLRAGVTTIADITRQPALTRPILQHLPLRVISFGEIRAMGARRSLLEDQLTAALSPPPDMAGIGKPPSAASPSRLTLGLSPHAPYSVEPAGYVRCLAESQTRHIPLMTHLAETYEEAELLADHTGPLRRIWDHLGGWDDAIPTFAGGPILLAQSLGLLDAPSLLAHVNYCDDQQMQLLSAGSASVVFCPRTHDYFGHPPHLWRDFLSHGINVCLGTDSRASSPDLNLLDDLRLVHKIAPDWPAASLFRLVTIHAARALGREDLGQLAPGARADLACFPAGRTDPLETILSDPSIRPTGVWIDGCFIGGRE